MINVVKYALEGLAVALAATIISRGKTSYVEVVIIAVSAMAVFLLLDVFAPLTAAGARHGAGFGMGLQMVGVVPPMVGGEPQMVGGEPQMVGGGDPDMCGGSLLEALQTAGAVGAAAAVKEQAPFNIPFKMMRTDYGAGSLSAGFNENADGYNVDKMDQLAPF